MGQRRPWVRLSAKFGLLGLLVVAVSLLTSRPFTPSAPRINQAATVKFVVDPAPAAYTLYPTDGNQLRNPEAVQRAVEFLTRLQPEGTYILSQPGDPKVVPMDLAHVAIAFAKVNRLSQAEAAMNWLYQQMIPPGAASEDPRLEANFGGSWYDGVQINGQPAPGMRRGRGEAVGMTLIATYTIFAEDPDYLNERIGDQRISDLVRFSVDYLTQPAMQAPDGRFHHSPYYRVPFNEENARMTLGLQLASRMLRAAGQPAAAERAAEHAELGRLALRNRESFSQGMAYDYYAQGIWGLVDPVEARDELDWLKSTGLVNRYGVKNWDWQLNTATAPGTWLRWWVQAQTISPSPTFDYALAAITAGDIPTALEIERRWLPRQRNDGGFDDAYLFGLRVGMARPTSYAAARFLLLERLLTDVVGHSADRRAF